MSLREPHLKMSKSHKDPRSRIHINDDAELIGDKIRLTLTDSVPGVSFDPQNRPGISNLLAIMSYFDHQKRSANEFAQLYRALTIREFKEEAARIISDGLASTREEYERLMATDSTHYLDDIAVEGSLKARSLAKKKMSTVREAVGLS